MIIINHYRLREIEAGIFYVHSFEASFCPVCGHTVVVIGVRKRNFINDAGDKQALVVRRLRCKECRKIHHELPDILIPYKRHCADTVEKVVSGDISCVCCDGHTIHRIKRWWECCQLYFNSILTSLCEKFGTMFSPYPAPREIVRAVANTNLWIHTRSACLPN